MSNYCALFAYACKFQHPVFEVIIFSMNFIFFMMELKFTITKKLVMQCGELSPLEIETGIALFMIIYGINGGSDVMNMTVGETFDFSPDTNNPMHAIAQVDWHFVFSVFLNLM